MNSFHVMWLCCWILFVGDIRQRFPSSQLSSLCPFSSVPFCFIKKWSQENEMCTQRQQGLICAWINYVSFWYKLYVHINTFLWRLWSFFFKHFKGTTQSAVFATLICMWLLRAWDTVSQLPPSESSGSLCQQRFPQRNDGHLQGTT